MQGKWDRQQAVETKEEYKMFFKKRERSESVLIDELRDIAQIDKRERLEKKDVDLINFEVGETSHE